MKVQEYKGRICRDFRNIKVKHNKMKGIKAQYVDSLKHSEYIQFKKRLNDMKSKIDKLIDFMEKEGGQFEPKRKYSKN